MCLLYIWMATLDILPGVRHFRHRLLGHIIRCEGDFLDWVKLPRLRVSPACKPESILLDYVFPRWLALPGRFDCRAEILSSRACLSFHAESCRLLSSTKVDCSFQMILSWRTRRSCERDDRCGFWWGINGNGCGPSSHREACEKDADAGSRGEVGHDLLWLKEAGGPIPTGGARMNNPVIGCHYGTFAVVTTGAPFALFVLVAVTVPVFPVIVNETLLPLTVTPYLAFCPFIAA